MLILDIGDFAKFEIQDNYLTSVNLFTQLAQHATYPRPRVYILEVLMQFLHSSIKLYRAIQTYKMVESAVRLKTQGWPRLRA